MAVITRSRLMRFVSSRRRSAVKIYAPKPSTKERNS
jgi:hypothetical protein